MKPTKSFWTGKRVLITGHSGFKGSWLSIWLTMLGAKVTGISLPPDTEPNLFSLTSLTDLVDNHFIDIRNAQLISKVMQEVVPDVVFHLAAQALVRAGYNNPLKTYSTNIMGTANLLNSIRFLDSVKVAIIITTDKVYKNREWEYPYRENDTLGGHDPYSSSKAACELVISAYRDSFLAKQGIALATCRAGNVIGGGDWSEDRLIPDAIKAWEADKPIVIRSPSAIRPWQHVLEPLAGYLLLAEKLWDNKNLAGAYNFGPETNSSATVKEIIEYASKHFGNGKIIFEEKNEIFHEAGILSLEIAKAKKILGLQSKLSLSKTIEQTMNWYLQYSAGDSPYELCNAEIIQYNTL